MAYRKEQSIDWCCETEVPVQNASYNVIMQAPFGLEKYSISLVTKIFILPTYLHIYLHCKKKLAALHFYVQSTCVSNFNFNYFQLA